VDQGPAAQRIEVPSQLGWTHTLQTKVIPTAITKAYHANHLTPMKGVKGKFKDEGYMGLLRFEVGVGLERFRF
jgi:hypothetical protein